MLLPNMLHFTELPDFLNLIGIEQHEVFLLQLHHPLVHTLVQLNVRVDQHGHFAADLAEVVDYLLHYADVETLFPHAGGEEFDHDSELVVGNGLESWFQLEKR